MCALVHAIADSSITYDCLKAGLDMDVTLKDTLYLATRYFSFYIYYFKQIYTTYSQN